MLILIVIQIMIGIIWVISLEHTNAVLHSVVVMKIEIVIVHDIDLGEEVDHNLELVLSVGKTV